MEEAAEETSSAEDAMILPIENTIAEEDINVSSEKPKNKSHYQKRYEYGVEENETEREKKKIKKKEKQRIATLAMK